MMNVKPALFIEHFKHPQDQMMNVMIVCTLKSCVFVPLSLFIYLCREVNTAR